MAFLTSFSNSFPFFLILLFGVVVSSSSAEETHFTSKPLLDNDADEKGQVLFGGGGGGRRGESSASVDLWHGHNGGTSSFFSHHENHVLKIIVIVTSMLSLFGCSLIFLSYFLWLDLRGSICRKMLLHLSFCDALTAFFYLVGIAAGPSELLHSNGDATTMCISQSFITTSSSIASFFWTVSIAVYLYRSLVRGISSTRLEWFIVFSYGLPILAVCGALGAGMLGYNLQLTAGWCWLKEDSNNKLLLWQLLAGKGWEILSYIFTVTFYILVKRKVSHEADDREEREVEPERRHLFVTPRGRSAAQEADKKLVFVPVVFVFLRIWGTLRFFLDHSPDHVRLSPKLFPLAVLQAFGDSAQGFANGVLFCFFTRRVRDHFLELLPIHKKRVLVLPRDRGGTGFGLVNDG